MFYLNGPHTFLESILALTSDEGHIADDIADLRKRYIRFAVSVGGDSVQPNDDKEQYCYDENRILNLLSKYRDYAQLTDIETDIMDTPHESRIQAMKAINAGKDHLKEVDTELYDLFNFVIHTMFYHRSKESGGGSVSSAPGVIWCAPRLNWTRDDLAEFLVHELAHNMLFIDERRYQHYIDFDDIANKQNYAISSILMRPRPLDKVFHSLIVAHEVLSFRLKNGEPKKPNIHPSNDILFSAASKTIDSIWNLIEGKPLVTDRFKTLLAQVEESLSALAKTPYLTAIGL